MMHGTDRREYPRFEIPGAEVRYRKTGPLAAMMGFCQAHPLVNVSRGGMAFLGQKTLRQGQGGVVQLLVPDEPPLDLTAEVQWGGHRGGKGARIVRLAFKPFGARRGPNPLNALATLNSLLDKDGRERKGVQPVAPAVQVDIPCPAPT